MIYEVAIQQASGGFGEYQAEPANGDAWQDMFGLIAEMEQAGAVEITDGAELPDGAEDIRGRIRNEPARVFALEQNGHISYLGIVER